MALFFTLRACSVIICACSFPRQCLSTLKRLHVSYREGQAPYESECVEEEFSEVRHCGVLGTTHGPGPVLLIHTGTHYGLSWSGLCGERIRVPQEDLARSTSKC